MGRPGVIVMSLLQEFDRRAEDVDGVSINYFTGGAGTPVVLLHGYPQSAITWHKIAPRLAGSHQLVIPDLRGYGDSDKPDASNGDRLIYCKRTSANDVIRIADRMGIDAFHVVGHDRGARVAHRTALDHPDRVLSLTSLDVVPTQAAFENMDSELSYAWFHVHFMRQPYPLPETLIGNSVEYWFDYVMDRWCATEGAIEPEAYAVYKRQFCDPRTIHATCSDYRSVALDLEHDASDRGRKLACPVLALWGANTAKVPGWQTGKKLNMLSAWRERANSVSGKSLDCGHFIPEEKPEELLEELVDFFQRVEAA